MQKNTTRINLNSPTSNTPVTSSRCVPDVNSFIHSRISIAPLKVPYSSEALQILQHGKKNNSFKTIIECVGKRPRYEAQLKREAIPYRRAINTKSAGLHESGTSKWD